jgi:hypothetical protein
LVVTQKNQIRQKIIKFQECIKQILPALPYKATEDFETNFNAIQSMLRIARNDAGHQTGASPRREIVYVYLQLFITFARQLMMLRTRFLNLLNPEALLDPFIICGCWSPKLRNNRKANI